MPDSKPETNPLAWVSGSRIITRNSDGGTTAWPEHDAITLRYQLGLILNGLADKRVAMQSAIGEDDSAG